MVKKNYEDKIERLFSEWEMEKHHNKNSFIRDGIVDYNIWKEQKPKIMFLFKEAYSKGNGPFTLTKDIKESGVYGSWNKAATWVHAITEVYKNPTEIPNRPNPDDFFGDIGYNYLMQIAIVNIKKSNGETESEDIDLWKYVELDKKRLKEQIELIKPDIILCGMTFDFYEKIYDGKNFDWNMDTEWCCKHNNRLVIDYWHFSNWMFVQALYYALCAVLVKGRVFEKFNF